MNLRYIQTCQKDGIWKCHIRQEHAAKQPVAIFCIHICSPPPLIIQFYFLLSGLWVWANFRSDFTCWPTRWSKEQFWEKHGPSVLFLHIYSSVLMWIHIYYSCNSAFEFTSLLLNPQCGSWELHAWHSVSMHSMWHCFRSSDYWINTQTVTASKRHSSTSPGILTGCISHFCYSLHCVINMDIMLCFYTVQKNHNHVNVNIVSLHYGYGKVGDSVSLMPLNHISGTNRKLTKCKQLL